ncbi:MAG: sigma-70 family RNA polymerase sigma factor [Planctomycetota bacterium]
MTDDLPETRASLLLTIRDPKNHEAWEEFVSLYQPVIYRVAVSRGLQHDDAMDLVQTVLISVANAIGNWEKSNPDAKFRHWLRRVSRNATLNAIARLHRREGCAGSQLENLLEQSPDNPNDESVLDTEYQRQLYLRASEIVRTDVDPATWKAFELTTVDGMSSADAARELGKSVGTVYAARSRVMKRLSAIVSELEESYR